MIESGNGRALCDNLWKFAGLDYAEIAKLLIEKGEYEAVAYSFKSFDGQDQHLIASKLIENNGGMILALKIKKFSELNHNEIAFQLLETEQLCALANNFSNFELTEPEIAFELINKGRGFEVARTNNFSPKIKQKIAAQLLANGQSEDLAKNLFNFTGLDSSIAFILIGEGCSEYVLKNLHSFKDLSPKQIALKLIKNHEGALVTQHLRSFPDLNHNRILELIIETNQLGDTKRFFSNFSNLSRKNARALVRSGSFDLVAKNLQRFEKLNQKIAIQLIEAGYGLLVAEHLESFDCNKLSKIADALLAQGEGRAITKYFDKFEGKLEGKHAIGLLEQGQSIFLAFRLSEFKYLDSTVAKKFIEAGGTLLVASYLERFRGGLDLDIANQLIDQEYEEAVSTNLNSFYRLDKSCALKLVNAGYGESVCDHPDRFESSVFNLDFALELIEAGCGKWFVKILDEFQGLDNEKIINKLIETNQGECVLHNRGLYEAVDHRKLALKLCDYNYGDIVAHNLQQFQGIDHNEIAIRLVKTGQTSIVAEYLPYFRNLDRKVAHGLIENGYSKKVVEYLDRFDELREFPNIAKRLHLHLRDYLVLEQKYGQTAIEKETNFKKYYETLEGEGRWKDPAICYKFKQAAERFGYRKMLSYVSRSEPNLHDACFALNSIIATLDELNNPETYSNKDAQALSDSKLFDSIFNQVVADTSAYDAGTSSDHLNEIAQSVIPTVKKLQTILDDNPDLKLLPEVVELVESFRSPEDVLGSWRKFKHYASRARQLVHDTNTLKSIAKLEAQGQSELANFYRTLAYHPDSNINLDALNSFVFTPAQFLRLEDSNSDDQIHNAKKPSNYTEVENLELSPEALRDALVKGSLDKLQVLPPFEVNYDISPPGMLCEGSFGTLDIKRLISACLGSRANKIEGVIPADLQKNAFSQIRTLVVEDFQSQSGQGKINVVEDFLQGDFTLSEEGETKMRALLKKLVPQRAIVEQPRRFTARIHRKSNPKGLLAGNDTACCMPFGSGKNNVYMFNPNCVLFTVEETKADGTTRTVAQSVLTVDIDIDKSVPEIITQIKNGESDLSSIISPATLKLPKQVLVCDSVETNVNFSAQDGAPEILRDIYQDFFLRLSSDSAVEETVRGKLDFSQILIGSAYAGPLKTMFETTSNTYIPLAPVSYSDNIGENSYVFEPRAVESPSWSIQTKQLPSTHILAPESRSKHVSEVTYRDALSIAYLEGKIYSDNENLQAHMHAIQNGIIAKDIANAHFNRSNLSLKYRDTAGELKGYILAYEGVLEESSTDQERVIFVADLAFTERKSASAGKLILSFLERYKKNYIDSGKPLPIFVEAREGTSYDLLQKQMPNFAKRLGVELEIIETHTYEIGNDVMHGMLIRPVESKNNEVEEEFSQAHEENAENPLSISEELKAKVGEVLKKQQLWSNHAASMELAAILKNSTEEEHLQIAQYLIRKDYASLVAGCLENFRGLDQEIAEKLIVQFFGNKVISNFKSFDNLDYQQLSYSFFDTQSSSVSLVCENIELFVGLDHSAFAQALIDEQEGYILAENLEHFDGLNHQDIAKKLIATKQGVALSKHIKNFQGLDHQSVAESLIESEQTEPLVAHIPKFNVDRRKIARMLIEKGEDRTLAATLEHFSVNHMELAQRLYAKDEGDWIGVHFDDFTGLHNKEGARFFIEHGDADLLARKLRRFEGLDLEIAVDLIDAGYLENVYSRIDVFSDKEQLKDAIFSAEMFDISPTDLILYEMKYGKKKINSKTNFKDVFQKIRGHGSWTEQADAEKFERAAERFGYKEMLGYVKDHEDEKDLHDLCRNLDKISAVIDTFNRADSYSAEKITTLSDRELFARIFAEVAKDSAEYDVGDAIDKLNSLVEANVPTPDELRKAIERYPELKKVPGLTEYVESIKEPRNILGSWKKFHHYASRARDIVHSPQKLLRVTELRESGHDALASFYQALAFHPDSSVDFDALDQFIFDTDTFLDTHDFDSDGDLHEALKPSNYTEVDNLNLTAEELRDALVRGSLDRIQAISPLEVSYQTAPHGMLLRDSLSTVDIASLTRLVLGSEKQKIPGFIPRNAKRKAFARIKTILNEDAKEQGIANSNLFAEFLAGEFRPSKAAEKKIRDVLKQFVPEKVISDTPKTYRARIHPKSSPKGILAGNDTASCMPFGSGKNNIYMFNPNCVLFTVEEKTGDNSYRTVAQSVLTLNLNVQRFVDLVVDDIEEGERGMSDIIDLANLQSSDIHLACDSVETNKNFISQAGNPEVLKYIYRDFFHHLSQQAHMQEIHGKKVDFKYIYVGAAFTGDFEQILQQSHNYYLPIAPLAYTDNAEKECYWFSPKPIEEGQWEVEVLKTAETKKTNAAQDKKPGPNISELDYHDILGISFIESEAYRTSESLQRELQRIQNTVIATDIANAHRGRPNLSIKYTDKNGSVRGYILAYEGVRTTESGEKERSITIADIATIDRRTAVSGKLIQEFLEIYKREYLDKGDLLPIYMDAPERSTYPIVRKHLPSIAHKLGVQLEIAEDHQYKIGFEQVHGVLLRPTEIKDDTESLSQTHEESSKPVGEPGRRPGVDANTPLLKNFVEQLLNPDDTHPVESTLNAFGDAFEEDGHTLGSFILSDLTNNPSLEQDADKFFADAIARMEKGESLFAGVETSFNIADLEYSDADYFKLIATKPECRILKLLYAEYLSASGHEYLRGLYLESISGGGNKPVEIQSSATLPKEFQDLIADESVEVVHFVNGVPDITPVLNISTEQLKRLLEEYPSIYGVDFSTNLSGLSMQSMFKVAGLERIISFTCNSKGLDNLEGIERLTELRFLMLKANLIQDITPLSSLTKLQSLTIDNNSINQLDPLRELTDLRNLVLNHNQIDSLEPLSNLKLLETIDVSHNQLLSIEPLTNLPNLEELDLRSNRIEELHQIEKMKKLKILGADERAFIFSEEFKAPPNLSTFNVDILNPGAAHALTKVPSLKEINCWKLELDQFSRVVLEDCGFSQNSWKWTKGSEETSPGVDAQSDVVKEFTEQLFKPDEEHPLELTLANLGDYFEEDAVPIGRVAYGDVRDDVHIQDISDEAFETILGHILKDETIFTGSKTSFKITDLEYTHEDYLSLIKQKPDSRFLKLLYAEYLRASDQHDLCVVYLESLRDGPLEFTPLSRINPYREQYPILKESGFFSVGFTDGLLSVTPRHDLSPKDLSALFLEYPEIAFLDLSEVLEPINNFLEVEELKDLRGLRVWHRDLDPVAEISGIENLQSLYFLALSNCKLEDISPLESLRQLQVLDLNFNEIEEITALKDLRNLRDLRLRRNQINDLSSLANLKKIGCLDISNNQITSIEAVKDLTSLRSLLGVVNPFTEIDALSALNQLELLAIDSKALGEPGVLKGLAKLNTVEILNPAKKDVEFLVGVPQVKYINTIYSGNRNTEVTDFLLNHSFLGFGWSNFFTRIESGVDAKRINSDESQEILEEGPESKASILKSLQEEMIRLVAKPRPGRYGGVPIFVAPNVSFFAPETDSPNGRYTWSSNSIQISQHQSVEDAREFLRHELRHVSQIQHVVAYLLANPQAEVSKHFRKDSGEIDVANEIVSAIRDAKPGSVEARFRDDPEVQLLGKIYAQLMIESMEASLEKNAILYMDNPIEKAARVEQLLMRRTNIILELARAQDSNGPEARSVKELQEALRDRNRVIEARLNSIERQISERLFTEEQGQPGQGIDARGDLLKIFLEQMLKNQEPNSVELDLGTLADWFEEEGEVVGNIVRGDVSEEKHIIPLADKAYEEALERIRNGESLFDGVKTKFKISDLNLSHSDYLTLIAKNPDSRFLKLLYGEYLRVGGHKVLVPRYLNTLKDKDEGQYLSDPISTDHSLPASFQDLLKPAFVYNLRFENGSLVVYIDSQVSETQLESYLALNPEVSGLRVIPNNWLQQDFDRFLNIKGLEKLITLKISTQSKRVFDLGELSKLKNVRNLELHLDSNGDLSALSKLPTLRHLVLKSENLSNLSPIQDLTELRYLRIIGCEVKDLTPFAGLNKLRWLSLSSNQITSLEPIQNLEQLRRLNVAYNDISDLSPLANVTTLEKLDVARNAITDVSPLSTHPSLREIWLNENEVQDVSVLANAPALEEIRLYGNDNVSGVTDLESKGFTEDQTVDGLYRREIDDEHFSPAHEEDVASIDQELEQLEDSEISEEIQRQNELYEVCVKELSEGNIPKPVYEDLELVDPESKEGKEFHTLMLEFAKQFYPRTRPPGMSGLTAELRFHDFESHPVRFLLSKSKSVNACFIKDAKPPIIVLNQGLFEQTKMYTKNGSTKMVLVDDTAKLALVLLHELTHMRIKLHYGVDENSKFQESLCYVVPLEILAENGIKPNRVRDLYNSIIQNQKHHPHGANAIDMYFDPHPSPEGLATILRATLADIRTEMGDVKESGSDVRPVLELQGLKEILESSRHDAFVVSQVDPPNSKFIDQPLKEQVARLSEVLAKIEKDEVFKSRVYDLERYIRLLVIKSEHDAELVSKLGDSVLKFMEEKDFTSGAQLYRILHAVCGKEYYLPGRLGRIDQFANEFVLATEEHDVDEMRINGALLLKLLEKESLFKSRRGRAFLQSLSFSRFELPSSDKNGSREISWRAIFDEAKKEDGFEFLLLASVFGLNKDPEFEAALREHPDEALYYYGIRSPETIDEEGLKTFNFRHGIVYTETLERSVIFPIKYSVAESIGLIVLGSDGNFRKFAESENLARSLEGSFLSIALDQREQNLLEILEEEIRAKSFDEQAKAAISRTISLLNETDTTEIEKYVKKLPTETLLQLCLQRDLVEQELLVKEVFERARNNEKERELLNRTLEKSIFTLDAYFARNIEGLKENGLIAYRAIHSDLVEPEIKMHLIDVFCESGRNYSPMLVSHLAEETPFETKISVSRHILKTYSNLFEEVGRTIPNPDSSTGDIIAAIRKSKNPSFAEQQMMMNVLFLHMHSQGTEVQFTLKQLETICDYFSIPIYEIQEFSQPLREQIEEKFFDKKVRSIPNALKRLDVFARNHLFFAESMRIFLNTLCDTIEENPDPNLRRRYAAELLASNQILESEVNLRLEKICSNSILEILSGKGFTIDDGSSECKDTLLEELEPLSGLSLVHLRMITDEIAVKIQAQIECCRAIEAKSSILKPLENQTGQREIDLVLRVLSTEDTYRFDLIRFLSEKPSEEIFEAYTDILSSIPDLTPETAIKNYDPTGAPAQTSRASLRRTVEAVHEQFWVMPIELRSVFAGEFLLPASNSQDKRLREKAFEFALNIAFPTNLGFSETARRRNKEARRYVQAYIEALPEEMEAYALGALLGVAKRTSDTSDHEQRIGEGLALFCEMMGAAETKVGQKASVHPSVPNWLKEGMEHLKWSSAEPRRIELLELLEARREEIEKLVNASLKNPEENVTVRFGDIAGAGSLFIIVRLHLSNGESMLLALRRPHASQRSETGFNTLINMNNNLGVGHAHRDIINELLEQGRNRLDIEIEVGMAAAQYRKGADMYSGVKVSVDEQTFEFRSAQCLGMGSDFYLMNEMPGEHFSELENKSKDLKLAILTLELNNILRGVFDSDRHGGNYKIDGNSISHFDFKATRVASWSGKDYEQTADLLYQLIERRPDSPASVSSLLTEIQNTWREQGREISPLVGEITTALLSLGECFEGLDSDDFSRVLLSSFYPNINKKVQEEITKRLPEMYQPLVAPLFEGGKSSFILSNPIRIRRP